MSDNRGRIFSDLFLELPDKVQYFLLFPKVLPHHHNHANLTPQADLPDYYDQIKLPIALNTVEVLTHESLQIKLVLMC